MKCKNFLLCKKYTRNKLCKDCLFYFNKRLQFKQFKPDADLYRCPICMEDNLPNVKFIKLKKCSHHVCFDCMKNIYFSKPVKKIPKNPCKRLSNQWNLFMSLDHSINLKDLLLNDLYKMQFYNKRYVKYFINLNKEIVPSIFKDSIFKLIKYEYNKYKYLSNLKESQYAKIKFIENCAYCQNQ